MFNAGVTHLLFELIKSQALALKYHFQDAHLIRISPILFLICQISVSQLAAYIFNNNIYKISFETLGDFTPKSKLKQVNFCSIYMYISLEAFFLNGPLLIKSSYTNDSTKV